MKKFTWIFITMLFIYISVGCGRIGRTPEGLLKQEVEENEDSTSFEIKSETDNGDAEKRTILQQNVSLYFWDKENNKLVCETRTIFIREADSLIGEIIKALVSGPEAEDLQPVISGDVEVINIEITDNVLTLDLSEDFLESEDLLVARTALVNTLTEQGDISYVKININGKGLTCDGTQKTQPLGVLTKVSNNINELIATESHGPDEENIKEINRELLFRDFRGHYLLSEIRPITIKEGAIAKAILEEVIKGPMGSSEGLYPVLPQGTKLLDTNIVEDESDGSKILELYFSKELKAPFIDPEPSRGDDKRESPQEKQERDQINPNREIIILSGIVYNLSELGDIKGVKINYKDKYGYYTDSPLYNVDLRKPLTTKNFPDKLGKKIKVYFANENATHLIPDYRAMSRKNVQIANTIIDELILGPREDTGQISVIPSEISRDDIRVWMDPENNARVMVDLPETLDGNKMGSTGALMTLYAIVNSLTDPVNTPNIKEVQFLVGGEIVKNFGNLELSEPIIRNPALIQE